MRSNVIRPIEWSLGGISWKLDTLNKFSFSTIFGRDNSIYFLLYNLAYYYLSLRLHLVSPHRVDILVEQL